jgi:hypothetical protein
MDAIANRDSRGCESHPRLHFRYTNPNIFALMLKSFFGLPGLKFVDWSEAFAALAALSKNKSCLILLDEISCMGQHDADFSGKLKIAWDTQFKKKP